MKRYKGDAERAEGAEDELKQEKRKLQKEVGQAALFSSVWCEFSNLFFYL